MKMVISPAKSLQFDSQLPSIKFTIPNFSEEANLINGLLKKKTSKALSELMHISDKLAKLNWERNQSFNVGRVQPELLADVRRRCLLFETLRGEPWTSVVACAPHSR